MPGIDNSFINSHSKAARDLIDPRGRSWQRRSAPPSFSNRRGLLPLPSPRPPSTAQTWKRKRTPLQERDGVSQGWKKKTVSVSLFCRSCSFQHWRRNREEVWGGSTNWFFAGSPSIMQRGKKNMTGALVWELWNRNNASKIWHHCLRCFYFFCMRGGRKKGEREVSCQQ